MRHGRSEPRRATPLRPFAETLEARAMMALVVQPITVDEGAPVPSPIATFAASDVSTATPPTVDGVKATIIWGDGTPPQAATIAAASGGADQYEVILPTGQGKSFGESGQYTVRVELAGASGAVLVQDDARATVSATPVTIYPATIVTSVGRPFTGEIAAFTDPNLAETADRFTALIAWGDGTSSVGTIKPDPNTSGRFLVSGSKLYSSPPPAEGYAAKVTILEQFAEASVEKSVPVQFVTATDPTTGQTLFATAGQPLSGSVASFTAPDGTAIIALSAIINWGDGTVGPGQITAVDGAPATFNVAGTHTYVRPDPQGKSFPIQVKVFASGSAQPIANVTSQAIVVWDVFSVQGVPASVVAGTGFSDVVVAVIQDSMPSAGTASFQAEVTYDDGTGSGPQTVPATITERGAGTGQYNVVLTGKVQAAGIASATVRVLRLGTTNQQSITTTINATDPQAGSISGRLEPGSDTGASDSDGITATPFPTFGGFASPFSVILLYGRRLDQKQATLLGRVVADKNGAWRLTVGPLPDGRYVISATDAVPAGSPDSVFFHDERNPLVIDTIGAAVVHVQRDVRGGLLRVYYLPDEGGFQPGTLLDARNYAIQRNFGRGVPLRRPAQVGFANGQGDLTNPVETSIEEGRTTDFIVVAMRFAPKVSLRSAFSLRVEGVRDLAGNVLGGVFRPNARAFPTRFRPYG